MSDREDFIATLQACYIGDINALNKIVSVYDNLQQKNQQLKEKINTYENPEDLTLMFMYCDEKAKDKIKQLKEVIDKVRKTLINSKEYKMANAMNLNAKQSVLVELLQILDKVKEN